MKHKTLLKIILLMAILSPLSTLANDAQASPIFSHIISDATVKYSETLVQDWETVAFDDSTWLNAVAPSGGLCDPSIPSRIPDSEALPVWSQTPQEFQTIYARKTFIAALPISATIQTMVDDDFDLYVNGVLVRSDWDGEASYFIDDISDLVQNGINVIAIKASDTFGGCQHLAFDVTVETATANCAPPPAGLISWWPADGNANDIVGGNDGVLMNGATFAPGKVGQAFSFDGGDDIVSAAATGFPTGAAPRTVAFWAKTDPLASEATGFGYGGEATGKGFYIFTADDDNGGRLSFSGHGGAFDLFAPNDLRDDQYHHVAVTYDGSTVTIYADGVAVASGSFSLNTGISGGACIGGRCPLHEFLTGDVDEVAVWDRDLLTSEIQAMFIAGGAGMCKEEPTAITLVSFSAEAGAGGVTLAWETGTELDNAGFNLYRAMLKDGPYTQVNDALIVAQGDPVSGASYSFADAPGYGTFYYQLEDIDYYGVSTLHGPVKATVARPFRRPLYRPSLPEF
jgi:hypothetical protein